jgi:DNA-binding HxlR family transcriptional regulator
LFVDPDEGDLSPLRRRAGCTVLSLLAAPLCAPVLRGHLDGPLRLPDLRERIDGVAQVPLQGQVGKLREVGALERRVLKRMPYAVENEVTDAGRGILAVADAVEAWLACTPPGPIALCSKPAKDAIKALVGGWDSTILHELAAHPLSLTELDSAITDISYPSLERRLSAMRAARQVKVLADDRGSKSHSVTDWTRQAAGLLVAAGHCERRHLAKTADPLNQLDVEAGFLLAVPLISLTGERSGECLLSADAGASEGFDAGHGLAGVRVEIENGAVSSCVLRLEPEPRTWALGPPEAWVDALVDGQAGGLRTGGEDPAFAGAVIVGLREAFQTLRTRQSP